MKSFDRQQLAGAVPKATGDSTFESLLDGIPDGCRLTVAQGQFKRGMLIAQRYSFGQPGLQRPPEPEEQVSGTAQLTATTFKHQAQQEMLRWRIKQCLDDLQIPTDLLQTAEQKRLRQPHRLVVLVRLVCMGSDAENPAPVQKSLHCTSECLQSGVLKDAVAVQGQQFLGITFEIRWQQQQQWRWRPSLLKLKNLALEDLILWFRRQRPDHQRRVTLELIR